jgi:hypothetical protein
MTVEENSLEVQKLAKGKKRLEISGLHSAYRLSNGWTAKRVSPENKWAREAYWSITDENGKPLGGGHGRLTKALSNVLTWTPRVGVK